MTYSQFLKNLNARGMFRIRPKLRPIQNVLHQLDYPQDNYPVIHIAGTNGKGSVAASLESVLRVSGYRTGLYTSPHLLDLRERIKIAGVPLIHGFTNMAEQVLHAERRANVSLTYFEFLTAISFHAFSKRHVDVAIIESGLGGTWDATNVVKTPLLTVITSIGLDHCRWLGNSEREIAAEKAGIIKAGTPLISGVRGPGRSVIAKNALQRGIKIIQIDSDFRAESLISSWRTGQQTIRFLYKDSGPEIAPFGLLGTHQIDNAAVVLACIKELSFRGWKIALKDRDRGLREACWPGRLQLIRPSNAAQILMDGAHNPPAMNQLIHSIGTSIYKNVQKTFLFSAYKDKDIASMGRLISNAAAEVCLCPLPGPRGASMKQLRASIKGVQGPVRCFRSIPEALEGAMRDTPKDGLVVVCGSLALIGSVLSHIPSLQKKSRVYA